MRLAAGRVRPLPSDGQHERVRCQQPRLPRTPPRSPERDGETLAAHRRRPARTPLILLLIGHTEILLTTCWRATIPRVTVSHSEATDQTAATCAQAVLRHRVIQGSHNASLRRAVAGRIAGDDTRSGDRAQRDLSILIGRGFRKQTLSNTSRAWSWRGFQRLGPNAGGGAELGLGGSWSCDLVRVFLLAGTLGIVEPWFGTCGGS